MINHFDGLQIIKNRRQVVDWDALYEAELPRVYNYFLYKVCNRELAEDLTATTFERAWKIRSRYNPLLASPATWLFGIARNVLREDLRRNKAAEEKLEPILDNQQWPATIDVEEIFQEKQDKAFLQSLLLQLPEREHDLIALKYGAGLSNREIAKTSGLSESNVGSILHRSVTSLQRKWNERHER